jgi:hypothetical protein
MRATVAAVVLGILLLVPSQTAANARGSGFGARPWHAAPFHLPPHYRVFRRAPLYGGFLAFPAYDDFLDYPPYPPYSPENSFDNPGTAPGRHCRQATQKTVTVPAEAGGIRQVTVTYCHH